MQNRYAGDIGDYIKLALLRKLAPGRKLGIAWYLYPDERHNSDGKHVRYLDSPVRWRHLDPGLFDALSEVVRTGRSVNALRDVGILEAVFHDEALVSANLSPQERASWRKAWFDRLRQTMEGCDLVFADPDNGLINDRPDRPRNKTFGKQMSLREATELAAGRPLIIYHHNTRFKGGHDAEVDHWLTLLGAGTVAVRASAFSCRTFFLLNPDAEIEERIVAFCDRWGDHGVRLHGEP